VGRLTPTESATALLVVSAALGFVLNAISTPLYRLLEGYAWPEPLRRRGVAAQQKIKAELVKGLTGDGWELGLRLERLARFPVDDLEIAPTRFGNALRSFETYGKSRFNLDSQTMWSELSSVVPKFLQEELDRSRAIVDFFVALVYLSFVSGILSLIASSASKDTLAACTYGVVSIALCILWYRLAITSSTYWSSTVQALVNMGRLKLAEQLGLQLPATLREECKMWGYLTSFVYYAASADGARLDAYRKRLSGIGSEDPTPGPGLEEDSADERSEDDSIDDAAGGDD
jgi:hypothetical protein